jgi:hypothetical protein
MKKTTKPVVAGDYYWRIPGEYWPAEEVINVKLRVK